MEVQKKAEKPLDNMMSSDMRKARKNYNSVLSK